MRVRVRCERGLQCFDFRASRSRKTDRVKQNVRIFSNVEVGFFVGCKICRRSDASKRIGFWGTYVLYGSDPLATEGYPKSNGALSRTLSCSQPLLGMWPRPIQGRAGLSWPPLTPATILKLIMVCQTEGA